MRLKKVEIMGFKSFVERTCLTFDSRVTAIVGPNGCGKSNIVDAIRWAMGEPSAKALRGHGMEDLIFHGTESHDPVGMAEVTLTFENTDGQVPSYLAGCSEIEVTRRLFRSGENEYTINKVPCRRKDVWELFMDTGVGNRSFAIVEQEKVARIISSRPEERRVLIEEIAGISRYRIRREAAQKKMEATSQNLLRIQDVRSEVWSQMRSLERQVKRAIQFRKLKQELLELERKAALRKLLDLETHRKDVEERLSRLEEEVRELSWELSQKDIFLEEERLRLCGMETEEANLAQNIREIERAIGDLEHRAQREEAELRLLDESSNSLHKEIEELSISLFRTRERVKEKQGQRKELLKDLTLRRNRLEELELLRRKEAESQRALKAKIDTLRAEIVDLLSERARLRNSVSNHLKRKEETKRERDRLQGELLELKRKVHESVLQEKSLAQQIRETELSILALEARREENQRELRLASKDYELTLKELRGLEGQVGEIRSRMEALERLQRELSGFQEGIRRLRDAALEGQLGHMENGAPILAELMELSPGFDPSFFNILGERLGWIVVEKWEHAMRALEFARENNLGRVGVFVVEKGKDKEKNRGRGNPGGLPFVKWDPGYEALGGILFQDLEMVSDLEEAKKRLYRGGLVPIVTPQGEFIDPRGVAEGGERCDGSMAFLRRKEEIRQLAQSLEALNAQKEKLATWERELGSIIASLSSQKDELQDLCHQRELKLAELKKDMASLSHQKAALERRCDVLSWQIEEKTREEEEISQAKIKDSKVLEELEKSIGDLQKELGSLQEDQESLDERMEALTSEITGIQVEVASLEEKTRSTARELQELEARERDLREAIASRGKRKEDVERRISSLRGSLECSRGKLAQLLPKREQLRQRYQLAKKEIDQGRLRLSGLEGSLNALRKRLREKESQLGEVRVENKDILLRIEHTRGELKGRLEIPEEMLEGQYGEALGPCAENDGARMEVLREQLRELQDVNLAAPEQYEELKARWEALGAQQEDLEKSIRSLQRAIQRIDRSSRKRFREAFEKLDGQFRKVFPILFEGGEAHLVLTQAEDVLESGLEIVARPPGKRLQNISLLSGGEKALTAVALIFAMLMVKETPFCLLDEVDAPLDEANVERFINMVRRLSDRSQFILVTHSKRTMEMADLLYGVTMETPGISKTVSVKLC